MSDKPRNLKFNGKSNAAKPSSSSSANDKKRKSGEQPAAPSAKRSKLEEVVSHPPASYFDPPSPSTTPPATQPVEDTQPFPDQEGDSDIHRQVPLEQRMDEQAEREAVRRQIALNKALAADNPANNGVKDGPYLGWKPNLPPSAAINYKLDPEKKLEGSKEVAGNWMWSGSLKGWCRYPCCGCGEYLTLDEAHAVYDFRSLIPEALARDLRSPPQYKIRPIALCGNCTTIFRARCKANPQDYNGRGNSVWTAPF